MEIEAKYIQLKNIYSKLEEQNNILLQKQNNINNNNYLKMESNVGNDAKKIALNIISVDQKVNEVVYCSSETKLHSIENELYEKYTEYKESQNFFMFDGKVIKQFKTMKENGIIGYTIMLIFILLYYILLHRFRIIYIIYYWINISYRII